MNMRVLSGIISSLLSDTCKILSFLFWGKDPFQDAFDGL